jgi:hypothetical protein
MSWHFSLAVVEDFLGRNLLDTASCAELKSIRIAEKSSCAGKKKAIYQLSLFGTMRNPLMASRGVDAWILSLRGSPASLGVLPANGEELQISATYGPAHSELSKKSDPDLSCSKMCQGYESFCPWSSETCADLSTPSKGPSLLPPPPWVRDILESASGYLPTTRASDGERGGRGDLIAAMRNKPNKHYLPTTSACDSGSNRGGGQGRIGPLRPSVRTLLKRTYLPTTSTRDFRSGKASQETMQKNARPLNETIAGGTLGGTTNPDWLDWYTGLPIGWSSLEPMNYITYKQWEVCNEIKKWRQTRGVENVQGGCVRVMQFQSYGSEAPCRYGPKQQFCDECSDIMSVMPHQSSCEKLYLGQRICRDCVLYRLWPSVSASEKQEQQAVQKSSVSDSIGEKEFSKEVAGIFKEKKMSELRDNIYLQSQQTNNLLFIMCQQNSVETAWQIVPIPRLVPKPKNRVERIKITGNIQVPAVVREAWNIFKKKDLK